MTKRNRQSHQYVIPTHKEGPRINKEAVLDLQRCLGYATWFKPTGGTVHNPIQISREEVETHNEVKSVNRPNERK